MMVMCGVRRGVFKIINDINIILAYLKLKDGRMSI